MPAAVIAIMVTEDEVDRIEMDMADGDAFILVIDAGVWIWAVTVVLERHTMPYINTNTAEITTVIIIRFVTAATATATAATATLLFVRSSPVIVAVMVVLTWGFMSDDRELG